MQSLRVNDHVTAAKASFMVYEHLGWRIQMRPAIVAIFMGVSAITLLGACASSKEPNLMNLRSDTNGPDEFSILPTKPLEMPKDLAVLPEPTPGGANLVDPNPMADALLALGGKAPNPDATSRGDGGIITYASRNGVTEGIRTVLAAEDLDFRKRNNGLLLERLFKMTVYFKAYRAQSLDQDAELARWRAQGVATPSAPPANK